MSDTKRPYTLVADLTAPTEIDCSCATCSLAKRLGSEIRDKMSEIGDSLDTTVVTALVNEVGLPEGAAEADAAAIITVTLAIDTLITSALVGGALSMGSLTDVLNKSVNRAMHVLEDRGQEETPPAERLH